MKMNFIYATTAVLLLGTPAVQAATIDLAALGFVETTQTSSGSGGVYYDGQNGTLYNDLFPNELFLDDHPASAVFFEFDEIGMGFPDFLTVEYDSFNGGDYEDFDIAAFGDNGSDTFEFLLKRCCNDLSNGTVGIGKNAIARFTSNAFDFSGFDPLSFFAANLDDEDFFDASTSFTVTSLESTLPAVPLPASLPLLLVGLGGLAHFGRRRM
jgi:hypothetical protein